MVHGSPFISSIHQQVPICSLFIATESKCFHQHCFWYPLFIGFPPYITESEKLVANFCFHQQVQMCPLLLRGHEPGDGRESRQELQPREEQPGPGAPGEQGEHHRQHRHC